ncbi:arsenate reductase (thioredoxin) [Pediococcus pentosaceus]|uniref:arsenate reductase (thioredoxin) n=2 Tax=Pediococcus pentosaceus TaxID=1255 RepID=UPI000D0083B7|nr:arsenate reductase (thioredoxin) [Pediococcus pentosaceus]AVL02353.1 arsenate reductase (thioredoxin) [Pediococcus pentosaceus]MBF7134109.1 arsenate reductase (thioredoxin) [Pediococcus pentosaceus]MDE3751009.1 arsenate reductase (thioredoxin) [Pediococcus pentosaceus]QGZ69409.1 arsenate reductase (thioredoxin) [Pediococcus pentosaceus]QPT36479.1 arsenate reductase (thioredoxin) [Pediococcus pentosaceus]
MQVYFLCTGNSCRSQMAEGFARKYFPDWTIASAGIEKHGLNQMAVRVMSEKGIDISKNESKLIDVDFLNSSDLVVTLCGDARDKCPMTPPTVKKEHWGFIDPALIQGTENDKLRAFRTVRDGIEKRIIKMRLK